MVNSVEEKMTMNTAYPIRKNENKMIKRLGVSNSEIRYLGKSNQKIRRKLY